MFLLLRRLLHENAALREALHWYAVMEHWRRHGINPKGAPRRWKKSPAAQDRGARAREVLDRFPSAPPARVRALFFARIFRRREQLPIQRQLHVPAPRSITKE